jgi:hypothetical protein
MATQAESDAALIRERVAADEAAARAVEVEPRDGDWRIEECSDYTGVREWRLGGDTPWGFAWAARTYDRPTADHLERHDPRRVIDQCGSIGDALGDIERIAERSPDPDSRMWARSAITNLRRIWEPDE